MERGQEGEKYEAECDFMEKKKACWCYCTDLFGKIQPGSFSINNDFLKVVSWQLLKKSLRNTERSKLAPQTTWIL